MAGGKSSVRPLPQDSRGPMLIGLCVTILFFVDVTVIVRLFSRYRRKFLAADDWCILVAGVTLTALVGIVVDEVIHWDWGKHLWNVRPRSKSDWWHEMQVGATTKVLLHISTGMVRISVCFFLRRLNPYATLRRILTWFIMFNVLWITMMVIRVFIRCIPVDQSLLLPSMRKPGTRCMPENIMGYVVLGCHVSFDLFTWCLPLWLVKKLNTTREKKIQAAVLLCVGLVACSAAAFRLPVTFAIVNSGDSTYDAGLLYVSIVIEAGFGILAASAPALKVVFQDLRRKLLGRSGVNDTEEHQLAKQDSTHTSNDASRWT